MSILRKKNPMPSWSVMAPDYVSAMRNAAESELSALNSSVNWALSLTLALATIVGAIFFDPGAKASNIVFAMVLLAGSLPLMTHFAIRIMKAYINIVRFSTLERVAVKNALEENADGSELVAAINNYHLQWKSPIPHGVMIRKTLFSFGLLYPIIGVVAGLGLLAVRTWADYPCVTIAALLAAVGASALEYAIFRQSAYANTDLPDPLAVKLR